MFTSKHFINLISSFIVGLISLYFVSYYWATHAYSPFKVQNPLLFVIIYCSLFFFIIISFDKIKKNLPQFRNRKYAAAVIIISVLILLYFYLRWYLNLNSRVSSGSGEFQILIIKNWLDNFYHGNFPYQQGTLFSEFPFLYLILSPFFLLNIIPFVQLLLWSVLAFFLIYNSESLREIVIKLFLLLVSPITFYGLFELPLFFLNFCGILILVFFSNRYLNPAKVDGYFILFSILFGLFFSLKMEIMVSLILYLMFLFRYNLKEGLLFCETMLSIFLLTIIPFILWNPKMFFINGPLFSTFMFNLPWWCMIIFLLIVLYVGWMIADLQEMFFASGILLAIYAAIKYFFVPLAGLSTLILPLPFLVFSITEYRIEKFRGKIIKVQKELKQA